MKFASFNSLLVPSLFLFLAVANGADTDVSEVAARPNLRRADAPDEDTHLPLNGTKQAGDLEEQCGLLGKKAVACGGNKRKIRAETCCDGLSCDLDERSKTYRRCVDSSPSSSPSSAPTSTPSQSLAPSNIPSGHPSTMPSASLAPTNNEQKELREAGWLWKMKYHTRIKWEKRGIDFCIMCINRRCEKGDHVATTHCNANLKHLRWEYIEAKGGAGLIKTKSKDLCIRHNGSSQNVELRSCDKSDDQQLFEGFSDQSKFELHPYSLSRNKDKKFCLTMLHHPLAKDDKDGEPIRVQPCYKAEKTETAYFEADFRKEVKEELRKCKGKGKCKECQQCSSDKDCEGDLKCYKRGSKGWRANIANKDDPNGWAQIPGCQGYGDFGKNYCSKKQYEPLYSCRVLKNQDKWC